MCTIRTIGAIGDINDNTGQNPATTNSEMNAYNQQNVRLGCEEGGNRYRSLIHLVFYTWCKNYAAKNSSSLR